MDRQGEEEDWDLPQSAINDFLRSHDGTAHPPGNHSETPSHHSVIADNRHDNNQDVVPGLFGQNEQSLPYSLDLTSEGPRNGSNNTDQPFTAETQEPSVSGTNEAMLFYTGETITFEPLQPLETLDTTTPPHPKAENNDDDSSSMEYEGDTLPISTLEDNGKFSSNLVDKGATSIALPLHFIEKGCSDNGSQTMLTKEKTVELIDTSPPKAQGLQNNAMLLPSNLQPSTSPESTTSVPVHHESDGEEETPTQVALSMDSMETAGPMSIGNTESGSSVLFPIADTHADPVLPTNDLLSSNNAGKNDSLARHSEKVSSEVAATPIALPLDFIEKGSSGIGSQTMLTKEKTAELMDTSPPKAQGLQNNAILLPSNLQPSNSPESTTTIPVHHEPDVEEETPTQVALPVDFLETAGPMSIGNTESGSSVLFPITDTHADPVLPTNDLLSSNNAGKNDSLARHSEKLLSEVNSENEEDDDETREDPNIRSPHAGEKVGGNNIVIRKEVTTTNGELNDTLTSENEFTDSEHGDEEVSDFEHDEELGCLSNTQETPFPPLPKARRRLVHGIRRHNAVEVIPANDATEMTQDDIEETRKIIKEQERRVELHKEKMREENQENVLLSKYVTLSEENSNLKEALMKSNSIVQDLKASIKKLNQKFLLAQAQIKKGDEEIKLLMKRVEQKDENILLLKKLLSVSDSDIVEASDEKIALLNKLISDTDSDKDKHAKKNAKSITAKKIAESLSSNLSRSNDKNPSSLKKHGANSENPTPKLARKTRPSLLPAKKPSSVERNKATLTRQSTGSISAKHSSKKSINSNHKSLRSTSLPSPQKKMASLKKNNQDFSIEERFQSLWQELVQSGWSYRAGPEPFNMVYVPPHGSTKKGAQESVDFYTTETAVIQAAHAFGHLPDASRRSNDDFVSHEEESCSTNEPECSFFETLQQGSNNEHNSNSDDLIDSQTSENGNQKIFEGTGDCLLDGSFFTLNSLRKCARCMKNFITQLDCDMKHFRSQLWKPIWEILSSQGSLDKQLRWTYIRCTGLLAPRTWIYGTPNSRGFRSGKLGIDYFVTEESVIVCMLAEIVKMHPSPLDKSSLSKISELFPPSCDDEGGNAATTRTLRKSKRQPEVMDEGTSVKQARVDKSNVTICVEAENKSPARDNSICLSQSAVSGVQMLLELSKSKGKTSPIFAKGGKLQDLEADKQNDVIPNPDAGTEHGPRNLAAFRKGKCFNREDIIPVLPGEMNSTVNTVCKTPVGPCHMSQSPSVSLNSRSGVVKYRKQLDLLRGFSFLLSGCSHVSEQVARMGGNVIETVADISLKRTEVGSKLFFLSEPSCRRRTKYLLAVALGLPMLHYHCLNDLEHGKFLSLFDNELYKIWRLPTGLSIFSGVFVLQRARHACVWAPPGFEDGQVIFQDMTFILAIEEENIIKDWTVILESVGATVISAKKRVDSVLAVDAVLIDSMLLSPQVTATPQKIEAVLRSVDTSTPIVDLSWAVQSLIARKKLNFNDDERFIAGAGIYSIKVKGQEGTEVRYEKGDTVKIRRNIKGDISHARINGIHLGERMLSVEILDPYREKTLVDGGNIGVTLKISEKDLLSHVILFSPKEYKGLKYAEINKDIFMLRSKQVKP